MDYSKNYNTTQHIRVVVLRFCVVSSLQRSSLEIRQGVPTMQLRKNQSHMYVLDISCNRDGQIMRKGLEKF